MNAEEFSNSSFELINTGHLQEVVRDMNQQIIPPSSLFNFHKCNVCPYQTKSYFLMKSHTKRHRFTYYNFFDCSNSIEKFKCSKCDFRTAVLVNFNKHMEVSHQKVMQVKVDKKGTKNTFVFVNFNWINLLKSYNCEKCDFKTYSQLFYIKHFTKCPLNAIQDSATAPTHKDFLNWHRQVKNPLPKFKCKKCPFETDCTATLILHQQRMHRVSAVRRRMPPPPPKQKRITLHLCPECNFFGESTMSLKNHILSKHTSDEDAHWYTCDRCSFKTKWRTNLYHHVRKMHFTKQYRCTECDYYSKQKRLLEAHISVNHMQEQKVAVPCLDTVSNCPEKENHKLKCPVSECAFVTRRELQLTTHMYWKHPSLQSQWLMCKLCNYKTIWEEKLKEHVETRHAPKPIFGCEICDFKCVIKKAFKAHVESHKTEESKWLKCELCSYKSTNQGDLKEHILKMHVRAESVVCFNCQMCTFKTIEENALKEHILEKHINPQSSDWSRCELCEFMYQDGQDYKKHILEKHIL